MAQWSPSGHSLAFVHQNDLYYVEAAAEVGQKLKRLTSSGKEGLVYNGVTDWLYEGKKNLWKYRSFLHVCFLFV